MTGNRLIERQFAFTISLLHRTFASSVRIVASKNAVLAVYDRGHQVSLFINIGNALFLDDLPGFRRQVVPDNRKGLFQFAHLFLQQGCTGITFHTANTFAMGQIA